MIPFSVEHNYFGTENTICRNPNEKPISFHFFQKKVTFKNVTILDPKGGGGVPKVPFSCNFQDNVG